MNIRLATVGNLLQTYVLILLARIMPRNPRKVVFGAWRGESFSDNPKYLMYECLRRGDLDCVWIGKRHLRESVEKLPRAHFAERGSWLALWHELTMGCFVCNIHVVDELGVVPTCGRVKIVNLWHGIPFKRIGCLQLNGKGLPTETRSQTCCEKMGLRGFLRKWHRKAISFAYAEPAWTSVSSEKVGRLLATSLPNVMSVDRMVYAGMPRNDFLVQNRESLEVQTAIKRKYATLLGVSAECRWYLYLPTWRHGEASQFSFSSARCRQDCERILVEQNAIIIEKQHPAVLANLTVRKERRENVVVLSSEDAREVDVQELLLASDRLITDYSSCFFDFALLNRPVIHFAYDREWYETMDAGVFYDLNEIGVGPIVYEESEMIRALAKTDTELLRLRASHWRDPIINETGHACEAILTLVGR